MEIEVIDGKREGSAIYHCGDGYYYHYNNGNLYNENEALVLNLRCRKYSQLGCAGSAKIVIVEGENIMEWTNRQPHVCTRDRTHHAVLDLRRNILQEASQLNGPYEAPSTVVNRVRNNGLVFSLIFMVYCAFFYFPDFNFFSTYLLVGMTQMLQLLLLFPE